MLRNEAQRKRSTHQDRARGTLSDGLKQKDVDNINKYFMEKNSEHGLRDLLNHLMGTAMCLRGNNSRMFELPDFFLMELRKEGPQQCQAMVAIMNNGKTNADGRNEYGACIRNKEVRECAVGAMAMYLFVRLQMNGEDIPDVQRRDNWYNIKLFKDKSPTVGMSYQQQHGVIQKAHKSCGVKISKVTHAARPFGATRTLADGASHDNVRSQGRWKGGQLERSYINDLPRAAMRVQAGFSKKQGNFFLKRGVTIPSKELQQLIFPSADAWLTKLEDVAYECDEDLAAHNFIEFILELRVVLIQDSVEMRRLYPDHMIWTHSVWQTDLYQQFVAQVAEVPDENPFELEIQQVIPLVAERIRSMEQSQLQSNSVYKQVNEQLLLLTAKVDDLSTRKLNVSIEYESR